MEIGKFSKGAVPVPYIIALLLGISVIAVIGYWFYSSSGSGMGTSRETICDAERHTYCNSLIYGGSSSWKASCGSPPTREQCLSGIFEEDGSDGEVGGAEGGAGADETETYTCENYRNQYCKSLCDDGDFSGMGSCPGGESCCLERPPGLEIE